MNSLRSPRASLLQALSQIRRMSQLGDLGSGAGKGGGGGGSIREAGGAFGRAEASREEEYFYKKQKEQLAKIKKEQDRKILFPSEKIKKVQEILGRYKFRLPGTGKK